MNEHGRYTIDSEFEVFRQVVKLTKTLAINFDDPVPRCYVWRLDRTGGRLFKSNSQTEMGMSSPT